jgi:hypothetical protein
MPSLRNDLDPESAGFDSAKTRLPIAPFRQEPMMGHLPAMSEHEYRENNFFEES